MTNQYTKLSKTPSGCRLLARLRIQHPTLTEEHVRIPEVWRHVVHVCPLPANMTRDDHSGRRLEREVPLARHYGNKQGIFYVDASGPHHGWWCMAAVVYQNVAVNGLTFGAQAIALAEEVVIARAAADKGSRVIITDSIGASRNIEQGYIPLIASRALQNSDYLGAPTSPTIVWAPAHMGLEGNEMAAAAARALTPRATPSDPSEIDREPNPALTFREITQLY